MYTSALHKSVKALTSVLSPIWQNSSTTEAKKNRSAAQTYRSPHAKQAEADHQAKEASKYKSWKGDGSFYSHLVDWLSYARLRWLKRTNVEVVAEGGSPAVVRREGVRRLSEEGKAGVANQFSQITKLPDGSTQSSLPKSSISDIARQLEKYRYVLKVGDITNPVRSERELAEAVTHWLPSSVRSDTEKLMKARNNIATLLDPPALVKVIVESEAFQKRIGGSKQAIAPKDWEALVNDGKAAIVFSYGKNSGEKNIGDFSISLEFVNDNCAASLPASSLRRSNSSLGNSDLPEVPNSPGSNRAGLSSPARITLKAELSFSVSPKTGDIERVECANVENRWSI